MVDSKLFDLLIQIFGDQVIDDESREEIFVECHLLLFEVFVGIQRVGLGFKFVFA